MPRFEDPGEMQPADWPGAPPKMLDFTNRSMRRIRDFLRTRFSLLLNIDCDVKTVRCTQGTEVRIPTRLTAVRGCSVISAASGQVVESAVLVADGASARVKVYFASGAGAADVTFIFWPEGNASGSGLTYYPALRTGALSGTDGWVLTRDSTQPNAAKWAPSAGGTGTGAGYHAAVLATGGLVSFYKMDDASGTSLADSFGANTGTLAGAAADLDFQVTLPNGIGNGIMYNAVVGSFFNVPRSIGDDFTIELLVSMQAGALLGGGNFFSGSALVNGEVGGAANDFGVSANSSGQINAGTGNADLTITATGPHCTGVTKHVVFTRVKATGALAVWVNGIRQATGAAGNHGSLTAPAILGIGGNASMASSGVFAGILSNVALYSSVLSNATIKSHFFSSGLGAT